MHRVIVLGALAEKAASLIRVEYPASVVSIGGDLYEACSRIGSGEADFLIVSRDVQIHADAFNLLQNPVSTLHPVVLCWPSDDQVSFFLREILGSFSPENQAEVQFRSIPDIQTELIYRFRPDGTVSFVNSAFCRFFDTQPDKIIGHQFISDTPADDLERIQSHRNSFNPDNPKKSIEYRIFRPDGTVRWVEWTDYALYSPDGDLIETVSVGCDSTERKEKEILNRSTISAMESRISLLEGLVRSLITGLGTCDPWPEGYDEDQMAWEILLAGLPAAGHSRYDLSEEEEDDQGDEDPEDE
ncbi:MAG TPA: PAS domain S-box protein [Methanospirillum sp.]|nr:PAS domain S-box protein [Methanospirillum sp.]